MLGREDEVADRVTERRLAVDRPIELAPARREDAPLGLGHGRQDRRRPGLVHEDARRQVDLSAPRVGAGSLGQSEDRVGRGGNPGERRKGHGAVLLGTGGLPRTIQADSAPRAPGAVRGTGLWRGAMRGSRGCARVPGLCAAPGTPGAMPLVGFSAMRLLALTCEVLARSVYLCAARSPHVVDVRLNRRGLHDDPPNLRAILQAEIDEVGAPYDAVALAYGLCGGATAGLRAGRVPLAVPRAHDCITLFLGDRTRYQAEFTANPGTYWYVQDYLERTDDGSAFGGVGAVSDASARATYESTWRSTVRTTPRT